MTHSLFEEDRWLEAVAPGRWRRLEVKQGSEVVASLPYVQGIRKGTITNSRLTPWLGPWVKQVSEKPSEKAKREIELTAELIEQLPSAAVTSVACAPEWTNMLPFQWAGFKESQIRYTYRIEDLTDPDRVWMNFRQSIRQDCRKAEKSVVVSAETDLAFMLDTLKENFGRKSVEPPSSELVRRIDSALSETDSRTLLVAREGATGRPLGFNYLVHDARHCFYLMSGQTKQSRRLCAGSFLLWKSILRGAEVSSIFDFEGSSIPEVERFVRGFGGRLVPRFVAVKYDGLSTVRRAAKMVRESWR